jgi:hypothetical protein
MIKLDVMEYKLLGSGKLGFFIFDVVPKVSGIQNASFW